MSVRAKFKVDTITRSKHWDKQKGEIQTIRLTPVTSGSDENAEFYAATPSGSIDLSTVNQAAGEQFKLGAEYYVDFTPAQ